MVLAEDVLREIVFSTAGEVRKAGPAAIAGPGRLLEARKAPDVPEAHRRVDAEEARALLSTAVHASVEPMAPMAAAPAGNGNVRQFHLFKR